MTNGIMPGLRKNENAAFYDENFFIFLVEL